MVSVVDLVSSTESECHDKADADVLQAWAATPATDAGGESSPAIVASTSAPACATSSCAGVSSSSIADVGASTTVVAGTSAPASGSAEDSTIAIDAIAAHEVGKPLWNQALQRKELVLPSGKVMVLQSSTPMEKAGAKKVLKRPAAKKRPASAIEGDHPQLKVVNANSRGATYLLGQSEGKDKLLVEVTASKSVKHKDIVQDIKASLAEMLAKDPNKSFQDLKAEALSLRTLSARQCFRLGLCVCCGLFVLCGKACVVVHCLQGNVVWTHNRPLNDLWAGFVGECFGAKKGPFRSDVSPLESSHPEGVGCNIFCMGCDLGACLGLFDWFGQHLCQLNVLSLCAIQTFFWGGGALFERPIDYLIIVRGGGGCGTLVGWLFLLVYISTEVASRHVIRQEVAVQSITCAQRWLDLASDHVYHQQAPMPMFKCFHMLGNIILVILWLQNMQTRTCWGAFFLRGQVATSWCVTIYKVVLFGIGGCDTLVGCLFLLFTCYHTYQLDMWCYQELDVDVHKTCPCPWTCAQRWLATASMWRLCSQRTFIVLAQDAAAKALSDADRGHWENTTCCL